MVKLAIQESTAAVMAATTPSQVYLHAQVHVQSMQGTSWECADGLASHAGPLLSLTRAQFRQAFLTLQLSICPSFVSAENDFAWYVQPLLLARQLKQPAQHLPLKGLSPQQLSQVANQYNHDQQRATAPPSAMVSSQPYLQPVYSAFAPLHPSSIPECNVS